MERSDVKNQKWWDPSNGNIDKLYAGVFEGGGAKGVAYVGALKAMVKKKRWFDAVAGASAGALTALLIAAGLKPEEIKEQTTTLFNSVDTSLRDGIIGLITGQGYFPQKKLKLLLKKIVHTQMTKFSPQNQGKSIITRDLNSFEQEQSNLDKTIVTFQDLYDATNIELYVICADISRHQLQLFSHYTTPKCSVIDAALASSAIPFFFRSQLVEVHNSIKEGGKNYESTLHHTLVDGGVSSNFPIFIFKDKYFRSYIQDIISKNGISNHIKNFKAAPRKDVIGFILKTKKHSLNADYHNSTFVDIYKTPKRPGGFFEFLNTYSVEKERYKGYEQFEWFKKEQNVNTKLYQTIILSPFIFMKKLASFVDLAGKAGGPLRMQPLRSKLFDGILQYINAGLGSLANPIIFLAVLFTTIWGTLVIEGKLISIILTCINEFSFNSSVWVFIGHLTMIIYAVFFMAVFVVTFFLILTLTLMSTSLIHPIRRLVPGLLSTYVSGSFVTPWIEKMPEVVSLNIPPELHTTSFNLEKTITWGITIDDKVTEAIKGAYDKTDSELNNLIKFIDMQE